MSETIIKLPCIAGEIPTNNYENLAAYRDAVIQAISYAESLEGLELSQNHRLALLDLLNAIASAQDKEYQNLSKFAEEIDY